MDPFFFSLAKHLRPLRQTVTCEAQSERQRDELFLLPDHLHYQEATETEQSSDKQCDAGTQNASKNKEKIGCAREKRLFLLSFAGNLQDGIVGDEDARG